MPFALKTLQVIQKITHENDFSNITISIPEKCYSRVTNLASIRAYFQMQSIPSSHKNPRYKKTGRAVFRSEN